MAAPVREVNDHGPVECCTECAVGERNLCSFSSSEDVHVHVGLNLMQQIPPSMQSVSSHQHNRHSRAQESHNGECQCRNGFQAPCRRGFEVRRACEIERGDCDQE